MKVESLSWPHTQKLRVCNYFSRITISVEWIGSGSMEASGSDVFDFLRQAEHTQLKPGVPRANVAFSHNFVAGLPAWGSATIECIKFILCRRDLHRNPFTRKSLNFQNYTFKIVGTGRWINCSDFFQSRMFGQSLAIERKCDSLLDDSERKTRYTISTGPP